MQIIEEEAETSKDAKNSSSKKSSMSGNLSFGHPKADSQPTAWTNAVVPTWNVNANRGFDGSGSSQNKNSFNARISARVTEVLPNGNLLIEGKRSVTVQKDAVTILLTGTIRPSDVSSANTVLSSHIADASIRYVTSGPVAREQQRGLFTRLWNWINPF